MQTSALQKRIKLCAATGSPGVDLTQCFSALYFCYDERRRQREVNLTVVYRDSTLLL